MSVWVCVPSARDVATVEAWVSLWKSRGYKVALWRDKADTINGADHVASGPYPGYAKASNALIEHVLRDDSGCHWCVCGGDDVEPDPNHTADQIARECSDYFRVLNVARDARRFVDEEISQGATEITYTMGATFGVMQPTGDRWGEQPNHPNPALRSPYIERVCGSPWMGREFCSRINQGRGPLWPEFTHMHVDECLQLVAQKLGVLWQRPDLTHKHNHWARPRQTSDDMPEFLRDVNTPEHWRESKAILDRLKAEDFKSCMPI